MAEKTFILIEVAKIFFFKFVNYDNALNRKGDQSRPWLTF